MAVLERHPDAVRRGAAVRGRITSIRTLGFLAPGNEGHGLSMLLPDERPSVVALSGSAAEIPGIGSFAAGSRIIQTAPLLGRSLAMGGLSLVALLGLLPQGERGLLVSASPERPLYALEVTGGAPS